MSDTPILSSRTQKWLEKYPRGDNADTLERIEAMFVGAKLPIHPKVIRAFLEFGGYCIPMGPDGRFKIDRARAAVRNYRFYGVRSDNPDRFRIQFGESEMSQTTFTMDGHGRLYEDGATLANSIVEWIEARVNEGTS